MPAQNRQPQNAATGHAEGTRRLLQRARGPLLGPGRRRPVSQALRAEVGRAELAHVQQQVRRRLAPAGTPRPPARLQPPAAGVPRAQLVADLEDDVERHRGSGARSARRAGPRAAPRCRRPAAAWPTRESASRCSSASSVGRSSVCTHDIRSMSSSRPQSARAAAGSRATSSRTRTVPSGLPSVQSWTCAGTGRSRGPGRCRPWRSAAAAAQRPRASRAGRRAPRRRSPGVERDTNPGRSRRAAS